VLTPYLPRSPAVTELRPVRASAWSGSLLEQEEEVGVRWGSSWALRKGSLPT